jgi:hypothetical protein
MNTPDSPTPDNKFPLEGETGDPKVNPTEKDAITNKDDTSRILNKDGVVADTDAIEETLSESEPSAALNVDNQITNNDSARTNELEAGEPF